MADQRITELNELAVEPAAGDWIVVVDIDASGGPQTKKVSFANFGAASALAELTDVDLTGQATGDLLFNVDGTNWQDTDGDLRIDIGDFEFLSNFTIVGSGGLVLRNTDGDVFSDNSVLGGGSFEYSLAVGGNDGIRIRDDGEAQFGMSGGVGDTTLISGAEVRITRGSDLIATSLPPSEGGLAVNNANTGVGLERVLTESDIGGGGFVIDQHGYQFSTSTSMFDPGAGFFRLGNATPSLATQISISNTQTDATDIGTDVLANIEIGHILRIVDETDLSVFLTYTVTSIFNGGTFFIFGISHKSGSSIPANNANVIVDVVPDPYFDMSTLSGVGSLMTYSTATDSFTTTGGRGNVSQPGVGETLFSTSDSILRLESASRVQTNVLFIASFKSNIDGLFLGDDRSHYSVHTGVASNKYLRLFSSNGNLPVRVIDGSTFEIEERAAALGSTATFGQLWVRNDAPNNLMFTDDAGTDFVIGGASGGVSFPLDAGDNDMIRFGDSQDFTMFFDGTNQKFTLPPSGQPIIIETPTGGPCLTLKDTGTAGALATSSIRFTDSADTITATVGVSIVGEDFGISVPNGFIVMTAGTGGVERVQFNAVSLMVLEAAAADPDIANYGQFWVRSDTPNVPMFTDDAGSDFLLNSDGVGFVIDQYRYQFSTSLSMVDPGSGFFRLNNAAPASATQISISDNVTSGTDIQADILANVKIGDTLRLVNKSDLTIFIVYTVTSLFDGAGFHIFGLSHQKGTTLPANNAAITVDIVLQPYMDISATQFVGSLLAYNTTSDSFIGTGARGSISQPAVGETLLSTSDGILKFSSASRMEFNQLIIASFASNLDGLIMGLESGDQAIHTGITSGRHLDLWASNGTLSVRFRKGSTLMMFERTAALADQATYGQFWVRSDTPNTAMFTDDAGTDFIIGGAVSAAYTRNATVVEDRTLLASASATTINNNNVLAALIADLQTRGVLG